MENYGKTEKFIMKKLYFKIYLVKLYLIVGGIIIQ